MPPKGAEQKNPPEQAGVSGTRTRAPSRAHAPGLPAEQQAFFLDKKTYTQAEFDKLEGGLPAFNAFFLYERIARSEGGESAVYLCFSPIKREQRSFTSVEIIGRQYIANLAAAKKIADEVAGKISEYAGTPFYVVLPITKERVDSDTYVKTNTSLSAKFPNQVSAALNALGFDAPVVSPLVSMTFSRLASLFEHSEWEEAKRMLLGDATDAQNRRIFNDFGAPATTYPPDKVIRLQAVASAHSPQELAAALDGLGDEEIYFPHHLDAHAISSAYSKMRQASISYSCSLDVDRLSGQPYIKVEGAEHIGPAALARVYKSLSGTRVSVDGRECTFEYNETLHRLVASDPRGELDLLSSLGWGETHTVRLLDASGAGEVALRVVRQPAAPKKEQAPVQEEKETLIKTIKKSLKWLDIRVAPDLSGSLAYWTDDVNEVADYIRSRIIGPRVKSEAVGIVGSNEQEELYFEDLGMQLDKWEKEDNASGPDASHERHYIWVGDGFLDYNWYNLGELAAKCKPLLERARALNVKIHFIEIGGKIGEENEKEAYKKWYDDTLARAAAPSGEFSGNHDTFPLELERRSLSTQIQMEKELLPNIRNNIAVWEQKVADAKKTNDSGNSRIAEYTLGRHKDDLAAVEDKVSKMEQRIVEIDGTLTPIFAAMYEGLDIFKREGYWGYPNYFLKQMVKDTKGQDLDLRGKAPAFLSEPENRDQLVLDMLKMIAGENIDETPAGADYAAKYAPLGPAALSDAWSKGSLLVAGERGALLEQMMKKGANLDVADRQKTTPLSFAMRRGDYELFKNLVVAGADPNFAADVDLLDNAIERYDSNPATYGQFIQYMLDNNIHPYKLNRPGKEFQPLHNAAMRGEKQVVDWLLERGEDPGIADRDGFTVLNRSVTEKNRETIDELEHHILFDKFWLNEKQLSLVEQGARKNYPSFDRSVSMENMGAINAYLNDAIPYVAGRNGQFKSPKEVLESTGDCDEKSILAANAYHILLGLDPSAAYVVGMEGKGSNADGQTSALAHAFLLVRMPSGGYVMSDVVNGILEPLPADISDIEKAEEWGVSRIATHFIKVQLHNTGQKWTAKIDKKSVTPIVKFAARELSFSHPH